MLGSIHWHFKSATRLIWNFTALERQVLTVCNPPPLPSQLSLLLHKKLLEI